MDKISTAHAVRICLAFVLAFGLAAGAAGQNITLRIVSYNIEADISGYTTARPGLVIPSGGGTVQQGGVLEGIGEEILGNHPAQPIDILALQETTSNTTTVAPIVTALNTYYNAPGMYAYSPYQATESGGSPSTGNGPNALIYNTTTVQLLASVPVDPPGGTGALGSSSGMYREVMRYEFGPAAATPTPANEFYIYVSHYKASTGTQNEAYRAQEAAIIRNDEASHLPADARVLYVGDYNVSSSTEASYQTILAPSAPDGIAQGRGIDPMNLAGATGIDWTANSLLNLKSESSTSLHYRDDFQVMTTNVYYGAPGGLAYVPGTYHAFGNNGTSPYQGSLNSGSNTALTNLQYGAPISAAQLYLDLTTASDHLPIVADYTIPISGLGLAVSPVSNLASSGSPGGPFSPASQTYMLTNGGTAPLNWTANCSAAWVSLSATNGTLAAATGTSIIVSINAAANALPSGNYSDIVSFANTSNGTGSSTRGVSLNVTGLGFSDDFSTYASGNLAGQSNWVQYSTASGAPLQVTGGKVIIPGGQTTDNQDAYKNFTSTSGAVFYGMTLTVTSAVNSTSPSYFTALYTGNNGSGSANFRLTAKAANAYLTNFVLGSRITGQSGDPYTFGGTLLDFGTEYRVIVQAAPGYNNMYIYVNPTSADLASQTAYAYNSIGTGTPPSTLGSAVISQYGTTSVPGDGLSIGKLVVSGSFATAYNALTPVAPPPVAGFSGAPTNGPGPLSVAFTDNSTGNITNRQWSFGDGATTNATATNITHLYTPGTYAVTLVASGPGGSSTNSQPNYITVLTPFQAWQVSNFGSTTNPAAAPDADPDIDGMSNWAEFMAGTDPTDPVSVFRIASISQQADDLLITWTMGAGRTNVLQQADSLDGTSAFADIVALQTTGSVTNYLDLGAATNPTPRYYRVRLGP